jgi:hypothetical protein
MFAVFYGRIVFLASTSDLSNLAIWLAELLYTRLARPRQITVKSLRRARQKELFVDAPMRDILGLSAVGLHQVVDIALIEARGTQYKWVMVSTFLSSHITLHC